MTLNASGEEAETSSSAKRSSINAKYLVSVDFLVRKKICSLIENNSERMNQKLQNTRIVNRKCFQNAVKTPDGKELPVYVKILQSYGPKHPISNKLNETHFLADINKIVSSV